MLAPIKPVITATPKKTFIEKVTPWVDIIGKIIKIAADASAVKTILLILYSHLH
jgi:hypothetical protein